MDDVHYFSEAGFAKLQSIINEVVYKVSNEERISLGEANDRIDFAYKIKGEFRFYPSLLALIKTESYFIPEVTKFYILDTGGEVRIDESGDYFSYSGRVYRSFDIHNLIDRDTVTDKMIRMGLVTSLTEKQKERDLVSV